MFTLKSITAAGVQAALEKAEHYRLLNDPTAAESICQDILAVDAANQRALVVLLLARTDQLAHSMGATAAQAREVLPRLTDPYQRAYYAGIIAERRALAALRMNAPGSESVAWYGLREAMEHYEAAERVRPAGNDEALLRWNACARALNASPELEPRPEEPVPITGD